MTAKEQQYNQNKETKQITRKDMNMYHTYKTLNRFTHCLFGGCKFSRINSPYYLHCFTAKNVECKNVVIFAGQHLGKGSKKYVVANLLCFLSRRVYVFCSVLNLLLRFVNLFKFDLSLHVKGTTPINCLDERIHKLA